MSGVEFASLDKGLRRSSPFPQSWGEPPADEEQRDLWILEHALIEHSKTERRQAGAQHARMLARLAETRPGV